MPHLTDFDPLAEFPSEVTPLAALVSSPAYCLIYNGRPAQSLPTTLSNEDAQLLMAAFGKCYKRFFGMEVGGWRSAPFYAAAFKRERRLASLFYYYSFLENGGVALLR